MEERFTILRNRKLPQSMDYDFLRQEGLKHIEDLASDLWTDYNVHDPGITIMEALCYAITELGYRCRFDMKDLLTDAKGQLVSGQNFFTAREILTINPLTQNDYRKLLADLTNVQNAWMIADDAKDLNGIKTPVNEIPLYIYCEHDELRTVPNEKPVFVSGLYRVLLSLEHHDVYGDLNDGDIVKPNDELAGKFARGELFFSIELPSWKKADFEFAKSAGDKNNIASTGLAEVDEGWVCEVRLNGAATPLIFGITLQKKPASGKPVLADIEALFSNKKWIAEIFTDYLDKVTLAQNTVKKAIKTLQEHRNLCEDFIEVTTIDSEQIAFCFDLDVTPGADIEKVQAETFFAIENYLNPPVHFYSLKELLSKKIPVEEIFNGPKLKHGFIDNDQLESTDLRKVIYASDIINQLMDIEGVIAVRNFQMTKYGDDGKPVSGFKNLKWCMPVTHLHKPVLRVDKSKILLFKNEFPFIARYDEVKDTILLLHAISSANKLNGIQNDIPVPRGIKRDTEGHWPVQYDFPLTYGVGEAGLPAGATAERVAEQRQLKAYLMFYEQLIGDFFSQLSNAHQLFSTNKLTHTYYAQFLGDIDGVKENIYRKTGSVILLQSAINNANSTTPERNRWQNLYEPKDIFEDRRGRFLDHLLARFAESFNDYALMMYSINYDEQSEERISFQEMAEAKINTLNNYREISSERGKAFNYFPQKALPKDDPDPNQFLPDPLQYWDTNNVSGLEKRICSLTGINSSDRRFLYCMRDIEIICTEKDILVGTDKVPKCFHSFTVTSKNGISMVSKDYEDKKEAEEARKKILKDGTDPNNYGVIAAGKFTLKFDTILTGITEYDTEENARDAAREFAAGLAEECKDPEGLHLIEHILLRPRTDHFKRMQVCLDDCDCPCENDPYTARISVVLPYKVDHFDNMTFRKYFENKIREEAPAHIMIKVCWLSNDLLLEFETGYKKWIEMLAAYTADRVTNEGAFMLANDRMIEILNLLHSEYPKATLHDCIESNEGSNTVVLNKTVLGTFKT